ncbi:hypothetical protein K490DRAFT_60351 [Saccharata proteae CBS 121410]|uniref:Uncharacterized protein n=1 Tax=Saccharata proteae CBS 121410 TaxID=1314787 RepID=A0A9P4LW15_9PEZI|nr:hypothetical protein K490DRAFT_60351 [Saccharata proteae CBS 121410]
MASSAIPSEDLASSLTNLRISTSDTPTPTVISPNPRSKPPTHKKPAQQAIADSWDDEVSSSDDDDAEAATTETDTPTDASANPLKPTTSEGPIAPPPTPASPIAASPAMRAAPTGTGSIANTLYDSPYAIASEARGSGSGSASSGGPTKRPEKTTAVAARLIAGGLGVRAPKRTEEEREYDRAVREKERKRREREREEKEKERRREELAKKSVWDD